MKERDAIILGALLHDIGKFVQRADENPKRMTHQEFGGDFFQNHFREKLAQSKMFSIDELNKIESLIRNHHDYEKFITLADGISAGMERIPLEDEEKGDPFSNRLISIFSRISISDKPKKNKYQKIAFLYEDEFEETFPVENKKCDYQEYKRLLNGFTGEINTTEFKTLSKNQVIEVIYFLLWKYTWCIPSAAYKHEPDVSLFDHLKTTAAIEVCLYDNQKENSNASIDIESPAFCVVEGDISGIQSYIFSILTQHGKIAKRLRARSLFVQIISEIAAHKVLHIFNLPLCNLIASAGGNFQILVPNLKTASKRIKELQKEFDEWTLEELNAELSINLASIVLSGRNLCDFSKAIEKLKTNLSYRKYQSHKSILTTVNGWAETQFLRPKAVESDEETCQSCRRYPQKEIKDYEENLCEQCQNETIIGQLLPKKKYLVLFNHDKQRFKILNYSFELLDEKELKEYSLKDAYLIVSLRNTNIKLPCIGFKFFATHIPSTKDIECDDPNHSHKKDEPVFFDCIAEKSQGDKLLGYLKIDIDNLGKLLRYGFEQEKPDNKYNIKGIKPSISRFNSLSRMLDTFFTGYLQVRLEMEFKEIYTVFSGGDDIFVIGPWNKVIDFAIEIRKKFSEYCAINPDFTFSAGVKLFKAHEPFSFCATSVDDALHCSKERDGKDGITIFGHTVSWDEIDKILQEGQKVIGWLEEELISRAFAYNLRGYGEMSEKYEEERNVKYLKFVPLLTYDINRNLTKEEQKEVFLWAEDLRPSKNKPKGGDNLPYLRAIMEYVLTYTRR